MEFQVLKKQAMHLIAQKLIVREEVDGETADERFSVCLKCDRRDADENTCLECGCFLDLKTAAKTNWNARRIRSEITHCPLGRWNDKEIANLYRELDGKELLT